jgi:hypothetical protein
MFLFYYNHLVQSLNVKKQKLVSLKLGLTIQ